MLLFRESTLIGSAVHEAIENYLLGKSWNKFTDDRNGFLANQFHLNLFPHVLTVLMKYGDWKVG